MVKYMDTNNTQTDADLRKQLQIAYAEYQTSYQHLMDTMKRIQWDLTHMTVNTEDSLQAQHTSNHNQRVP